MCNWKQDPLPENQFSFSECCVRTKCALREVTIMAEVLFFFCLGRKMTVVLTLVNCGGYLSKMCTYIYTQRERGACVHNSNSQTVVSPQSSDFHFVAHSSSHSLHIFLSFHIPIFLFPAFISRASWLFRIFSHDYFSCMTLKCTREWAGVTGMAAVEERNKNKKNSLLGSSQIQGSDACFCRKIHTHTHADIHCMKVSSSCCDSLVLTHSHVLASGTSRFRLQSAMQPKGIHSNEWKTKKWGGEKKKKITRYGVKQEANE